MESVQIELHKRPPGGYMFILQFTLVVTARWNDTEPTRVLIQHKDEAEKALKWLKEHGFPDAKIVED